MEKKMSPAETPEKARFIEGRDYYFENGLLVMTESYLRSRGYCCENDCRHCPYGFTEASKKMDGQL